MLFGILLDVSDSITNCSDLFSSFIRNRDAEYFLEFHNQFYCIQRICTEVIGKTCTLLNFAFFYTKFVNNDGFYFCSNVFHFL